MQVQEGFEQFHSLSSEKVAIRPQGLFRKNSYRSVEQISKARHELRDRFKFPDNAIIILGIGYADHRKGVDLFVETAAKVCSKVKNIYFLWVGHLDQSFWPEIVIALKNYNLKEHIKFPWHGF